jgi:hypothetical protein
MSVRLVREARKPLPKDRKHRQRHFWSVGSAERLAHVILCNECFEWRWRERPARGSNF